MTLNRALDGLDKVNQYDYRVMLKEFKLEEILDKKSKDKVIKTHLKNQAKKFFQETKKWKENLEKMKSKKVELLEIKQNKLIKKMIKKNKTV